MVSVGRVWPRHGHRGRPLNSVVRGLVSTRIDLSKLPPVPLALLIIGLWFSIAVTLASISVLLVPGRSVKVLMLATLLISVVGSAVHILISLALRRRDKSSHNGP